RAHYIDLPQVVARKSGDDSSVNQFTPTWSALAVHGSKLWPKSTQPLSKIWLNRIFNLLDRQNRTKSDQTVATILLGRAYQPQTLPANICREDDGSPKDSLATPQTPFGGMTKYLNCIRVHKTRIPAEHLIPAVTADYDFDMIADLSADQICRNGG